MGFQIPQLNTSLCGCSLRTGSLIVGYVHLVIFILGVFAFEAQFIMRYGYHGNKIAEVNFLENSELELGVFSGLLFTICFIFGCHTNTPTYMMSFILYQCVSLFTSLITVVLSIFMHIMGIFLINTVIVMVLTVLQVYYTLIIYNHYQNLREGIIN